MALTNVAATMRKPVVRYLIFGHVRHFASVAANPQSGDVGGGGDDPTTAIAPETSTDMCSMVQAPLPGPWDEPTERDG